MRRSWQGFFNIPVDHLFGSPVLVSYFKALNLPRLTVVSRTPAAGAGPLLREEKWMRAGIDRQAPGGDERRRSHARHRAT